ncbi:MAG TPA: hypothetical protein VHS03_01435 [Gaiellaceae bacterium]|nr:hypothetical protein [Gaiellaceae bacterium]
MDVERPRCKATTQAGKPCRNRTVPGSELCAAHLGRVGRTTNLTPELAERLTLMLRSGTYLPIALKAVAVPPSTYRDWMRRGRSQKAEDAPFRELREQVDQAQAEAEVRLVAEITSASRGSWQAAAWLLERLAPTRYGKPSVRLREQSPPAPEATESPEDDPFNEVDELAERRRTHY